MQARNRLDATRARIDTRAWVMARRERTRHLIELGGLVQKAGLVSLTDDDRALLYGAFLDLAIRLQGDDGAQAKLLYRRRGVRAFATEAEEASRPQRGKQKAKSAASENGA
ncbi:probable conjugal transfer protein traD [hydrothermal vent metagenome]|jgi:hypothetical protein|uniref:Probable conjugal transfer protein traD n=1 Tax=hydrothermal vent metagenome TaxID=652676 RepID=A0A160TG38_9ZZZZ